MNANRHVGLSSRLAAVLDSLPEVRLAYLFGSHARGEERPDSDIDVAVLVDPSFGRDPRRTLSLLFDRLGTVAPSDRLDIVLLNEAPSLLRHRVISTGRLLVECDPLTRVRFVTKTIRDYQDMQVRREFFYRNRVKRLREGASDGGSRDLLAQARRVARLLGEAPGLPHDE